MIFSTISITILFIIAGHTLADTGFYFRMYGYNGCYVLGEHGYKRSVSQEPMQTFAQQWNTYPCNIDYFYSTESHRILYQNQMELGNLHANNRGSVLTNWPTNSTFVFESIEGRVALKVSNGQMMGKCMEVQQDEQYSLMAEDCRTMGTIQSTNGYDKLLVKFECSDSRGLTVDCVQGK